MEKGTGLSQEVEKFQLACSDRIQSAPVATQTRSNLLARSLALH